MYFDRIHLIETIKSDMTAMSQIAENLFATNLRLMKTEADVVATEILSAAMTDATSGEAPILPAALAEQAQIHNYLSLTVLDSRGIAASYGNNAPEADFVQGSYARRTFIGERIITTTELTPEGELLLRLCVPMGSRILVATLPGMVLSDIISNFRIWDTGNILLLDEEGVIIANIRPFLVQERRTLRDISDPVPAARREDDFFQGIREGRAGAGVYKYGGVPRVGTYIPVTGSDNWMLIVAAPIEESPGARNRNILLISAAVFMGMGILAAFIAANFIVIPFIKIQDQNVRLAELRKTAENASRAKSDFLSNMSHEMRTPMNAIIGMTSIAKSSDKIERKDYCLAKIEDASTHLLGVINDILDMSKIEANKFELNPVEFSFDKMLQKTINVISFRVDQKQQILRVRLDKNIPPFLIGDDQRIIQVIVNLLSNAVKFTPEKGSIQLTAKLLEEQNGNPEPGICTIAVSVTDSGIGISEEQQAKLFNSFTQAESTTSRKFGGTGLGLAISKRIVEMMNGKIWMESELGKGSTFSFTIEAAGVSGKAPDPELSRLAQDEAAHNDRGCFRGFHILIAEDVEINQEIIMTLLEPTALSIDCANNGAEAVKMFAANPDKYAMIFMDVQMPEMDGFEATRAIRTIEAGLRHIPIVAMTANVFKEDVERCLASGMNDHVGKPVDISEVMKKLRQYLGQTH
jgi:signal transduction histidine kinase